MPVFHKHKIIFFHIGKTGGYSVEKALGLKQLDYREFNDQFIHGLRSGVMTQHATPGHVRKLMCEVSDDGDKIFNEYMKFTVVRNPWDRMVSAFKYLHVMHMEKFGAFDKWLEHKYDMVINNKYNEGSHYIPQIKYLTDSQGNPACDRVIRFENLYGGFDNICKESDIVNRLSHLNKSKDLTNFKRFYNTTTQRMVKDMYAEEIERFNYKFR